MKNVNNYLRLAEEHAEASKSEGDKGGFFGNMPSSTYAILAQAYATMAVAAAHRDS